MTRRKGSLGDNRRVKDKSSNPNNQIETDINSLRADKTNDHQCASLEQHKELRTTNKPL